MPIRRAVPVQGLRGVGVSESEFACVQHQAMRSFGAGGIQSVANDRVSDGLQMHPQLMAAACEWLQRQQ